MKGRTEICISFLKNKPTLGANSLVSVQTDPRDQIVKLRAVIKYSWPLYNVYVSGTDPRAVKKLGITFTSLKTLLISYCWMEALAITRIVDSHIFCMLHVLFTVFSQQNPTFS